MVNKVREFISRNKLIVAIATIALLIVGAIGAINLFSSQEVGKEDTSAPAVEVSGNKQEVTPPQEEEAEVESAPPSQETANSAQEISQQWLDAVNTKSGDDLANAIKPFAHTGLVETMRLVDMTTFPHGASTKLTGAGGVNVLNDNGETLYTLTINSDGYFQYLTFTALGNPSRPGVFSMTPFEQSMEELWHSNALSAANQWASYDAGTSMEERERRVRLALPGDGYVAPLLSAQVPGASPQLAIPSKITTLSRPQHDVPDGSVAVSFPASVYDAHNSTSPVLYEGTITVTLHYADDSGMFEPYSLTWQ